MNILCPVAGWYTEVSFLCRSPGGSIAGETSSKGRFQEENKRRVFTSEQQCPSGGGIALKAIHEEFVSQPIRRRRSLIKKGVPTVTVRVCINKEHGVEVLAK